MWLWCVLGGKPIFNNAKKLVVYIQKAVEQKLNMLEIKFLHKNISYHKGNQFFDSKAFDFIIYKFWLYFDL